LAQTLGSSLAQAWLKRKLCHPVHQKQLWGGVMQQPSRDAALSAARIAEILRSSHDPWPQTKVVNPVEWAHNVISHQRRLLDIRPAAAPVGSGHVSQTSPTGLPNLGAYSAQPCMTVPSAVVQQSVAETQAGQFADRVSLLVAGVQRQFEAERLDMEKQFVHVGARMDERVRVLETRVAACEGRVETHDRYGDDPHSQAAANAAMTRAIVHNSLSEVDAQWQMEHEELRTDQQQQLHQLEDLASEVRHVASRVQQAEAIMGGFERTLRRSEEEVQGLLTRDTQRPPWFGQLEGAIAALELRFGEQQVAAEVQLGRVRVDVDGLLRRTEGIQGLRDELFQEVEECLRQEFERRLDLHRNDSQLRSGPPGT